MAETRTRIAPPAALVALAGWFLPGAGYWLIGERARAIVIGVAIVLMFVGGILVGGVRVVDPPSFEARQNDNGDKLPVKPVSRVLQKPWFIGQFFTGPINLGAAWWSRAVAADPFYARNHVHAHGRIADIGTLYTAVAGMMNLMAIIDAAYRAGRGGT
jgi:hypothetical protein